MRRWWLQRRGEWAVYRTLQQGNDLLEDTLPPRLAHGASSCRQCALPQAVSVDPETRRNLMNVITVAGIKSEDSCQKIHFKHIP